MDRSAEAARIGATRLKDRMARRLPRDGKLGQRTGGRYRLRGERGKDDIAISLIFQRAAAEVEAAAEVIAGQEDVAERIDREPDTDVVLRAPEAVAPEVFAGFIELRQSEVDLSPRHELSAAKIDLALDGPDEDHHIAVAVHGDT